MTRRLLPFVSKAIPAKAQLAPNVDAYRKTHLANQFDVLLQYAPDLAALLELHAAMFCERAENTLRAPLSERARYLVLFVPLVLGV